MKIDAATRARLVALIAERIEHSLEEWRTGRMTSPDQRDYVEDGHRVLSENLPDYIGSTDEGREFLATELYEDAGETYVTVEDVAAHIFDVLTAE